MSTEMILLIVSALLLVVAIIVFFVSFNSKNKNNNADIQSIKEENIKLEANISILNSQLEEKNKEIAKLNNDLRDYNLQNKSLSNDVVRAKKNDEFIQEKLKEKNELISELNQKFEAISLENKEKEKKITSLQGENEILSEKLNNTLSINQKQEQNYDKLQEEYKILHKQNTETIALLQGEKEKNQNLEQSFTEYKSSLEKLNKQNEEHIQNLTNKILEEKTKKFSENNTKEMESIVLPLKEQINEFKKKVEEGNEKQTVLHTSLETQIKNIIAQTKAISEDAIKLTNALKGENKRAGNWGEHILDTILQNSGLIKGIHYESQQNITTEDNRRLIPDFIVHLPNTEDGFENTIVIDSKVSLVAYERYFHSETEEEKEINLQEHIKSVRNHIDELASKNYELVTKGSLGFVMMFIPIEPAYLVAVQGEPTLWEYAYKKKIILISATNMITSLRLIADIWKIDTRNKEAQSMAETCGGIYDKLLGFLETFEDVGSSVSKAQEQYEKAKGQLITGKGNVIKRLGDLRQKGINSKSKKSIPLSFEGE